jgi:pimeloyl-ACP methyl ester carboxylesterase
MCTAALWSPQCRELGDIAHCVALELDEGDSMSAMADSVLRRAPAHFAPAGLSMGGHVAMEIMRKAPERVERLALVGTRADVDSPERLRLRKEDEDLVATSGLPALIERFPDRWLSPEHAADPSFRLRVIGMATAVGPETREKQRHALLTRIDSRSSLANIACPTLVMCGREDLANPAWMHLDMASRIAGTRLRILEDCGHLAPIEQPEAVTRALRDWLASEKGS